MIKLGWGRARIVHLPVDFRPKSRPERLPKTAKFATFDPILDPVLVDFFDVRTKRERYLSARKISPNTSQKRWLFCLQPKFFSATRQLNSHFRFGREVCTKVYICAFEVLKNDQFEKSISMETRSTFENCYPFFKSTNHNKFQGSLWGFQNGVLKKPISKLSKWPNRRTLEATWAEKRCEQIDPQNCHSEPSDNSKSVLFSGVLLQA